jgi:hypothetical protein
VGAVFAAFGLSGPLAVPAAAADSCPNAAVRAQQHVTALPQCRAYELINPPGTDLGDVNRVVFSTDDGNAVGYLSVGANDHALGAGVVSISLARRGSGGWTSTSADPAATGVTESATGFTDSKAFSTDLSRQLVTASLPMIPSDTDGIADNYRTDVGIGSSTLMTQDEGAFPAPTAGASQDLDRIVYVGTDSVGNRGLYVSDGMTRDLVSVYPGGAPLPPGQGQVPIGQYARGLNVGGFAGRDTSPFVQRGGAHAISDDARRIYFSDFSSHLYVRDLATSPARTVALAISSRAGDVDNEHDAAFLSASHDGTTAYFFSGWQLTDDATPGGGIYRFDLASGSVTQVSPDAGPGGVGIVGAIVSDDQSRVYFTSTSALDGAAQPGDLNAYVWTIGGGFRFIAKVGASDALIRVTPDGRYALFMTSASVNGAPNNGFRALYRYDYAADKVTCVSCRPDGSPSNGVANIDDQSYGEPGAPMINNRALSSDGEVAFTSTDRIVPEDRTFASDVYLYHDGTTSLLTPGRGDTNSFVGDISDDGKNVSVMTRLPLVGADRDAAEYDAYNVRADGGFLEPAPGSPCHGEDCQGAPVPPAPEVQPSSTRVTGEGNAPPSRTVKVLSLASLTSAQRATLARTGKVVLSAHVTGAGKVSLRGRGRIKGQTKTLGSASAVILKRSETVVKLTFKLTTAARRELSRRHRLSIALEARLSGVSKAVKRTINLTRASR